MSTPRNTGNATELQHKDPNSTGAASLPSDKGTSISEFDQNPAHKHLAAGFFKGGFNKNPMKPASTAAQIWDILSHPMRINLP